MAQRTEQINSYVDAAKELLEAFKLHADQTRTQQGSDDPHVRALKEISNFAAKTAKRLMEPGAEANVVDYFTQVPVSNGTYAKDTMILNAMEEESTHSEESNEIVVNEIVMTIHQVLQEKLSKLAQGKFRDKDLFYQ
ncbi:hypothetical protein Ddc_06661 [Ditylenchus destructor]|nr:hypothetical protein Ddc_06661 [Ditylenchus destructor]